MPVIGRIDRPDGRWYDHPFNDDDPYESITYVLGMTKSKAFLQNWAAVKAARLLLRNMDLIRTMLAEQGYAATLKWLKDAARRDREVKADLGSHVHDVQEALILGNTEYPGIPEHILGVEIDDYDDSMEDGETVTVDERFIDGIVDGFLNFMSDFDVEPEHAELTVANPTEGIAGTLDLGALLKALHTDMCRALIDTKTGKHLDPDVGEQLAGYMRCRQGWIDLGNIVPMPRFHIAAVLHLRTTYRRGYKLLRQDADHAAWGRFLARRDVLRGFADQPSPYGRPLYPALPDGTQPPPLIEDIHEPGFNRSRKPLEAAGFDRLDDLVAFTAAEVLAVKGIGEKSLDHIRRVLADHGLALTGDGVTVEQAAGIAAARGA